tara:strand:+ start:1629 stop:1859 length:231 start_codon:yes stop_codon:yes gene_type:complete
MLVDNNDNIVHAVDLNNRYTLEEARRYFVNLKQIDEKEFNTLWRVMTEQEHKRRKFNSETIKEYEEFGDWLDLEKS